MDRSYIYTFVDVVDACVQYSPGVVKTDINRTRVGPVTEQLDMNKDVTLTSHPFPFQSF
jgi:hypothetical protein